MPANHLAAEYQNAGRAYSDERERLILSQLDQVYWIASQIHERLPASITIEDLVSTGIVGLINAVDNFDASYNVQLQTYAAHKIRGAILDSIRGLDGVPAHKRHRIKDIQKAISKLEQQLQRAPSSDEIASALNMSVTEYHESLNELKGVTLGSLEIIRASGETDSHLRYIADHEDTLPLRILERAELEKLLASSLDELPEIERIILNLYYVEELTLREIGQTMNLHLSRISQLKAQAILRLRGIIAQEWPAEKGRY
jgi:RNA polymerase sigma factor FliA